MSEPTQVENLHKRVGVDGQGFGNPRQGSVVERLSKYGIQVMPSAIQRRSVLQRQQETTERFGSREAPERTSVSTAMRKKHLKELLLTDKSHTGFGSVFCSPKNSRAPCETEDAGWALYPTEHAWMLSAVDGNYDTLLEFLAEDPYLLTRRDFVSGYTVLHWLAKKGRDESLLNLLSYAQSLHLDVNVNVRGSGGLTPLHLASMHGHYMVIKLLVGAFGANIDAMDYSGKRAWQYLKGDTPIEIKKLLGTWDDDHLHIFTRNAKKHNSVDQIEPVNHEEIDALDSPFERTKSRSSWRFGSVRKMLKSLSSGNVE